MLNSRAQVRQSSAAWVVGVVVIIGFIIGAVILSTIDPFAQGLMNSQIWSADSVEGQNLLRWMAAAWAFIGGALILALLIQIQVDTRNPQ